ncbi:MAG TPA: TRAP transporter small permease subunit [Polyangiales bacterium]|nr:TRAP transporter small permease subunit [Polyangiales bacterium]
MEFFRRLDRAWARGEGALTVLVLLSMVFVAAFSAGVRNLTRFDIQWANEVLTDMEWADSFLRKATMWLAFLGASQACYYRKHISIDVLIRIAPLKQRYMMHAAAGFIAALITFGMSYSLWKAVELNLAERPIEYEMLTETGSQHVCDASAEELKALEGVEVPTIFCGVRSTLQLVGITPETPGSAFQLIVPFMFMVMGIRFFGAGLSAASAVASGDEALQKLEQEEHARLNAVHAAAAGGLVESPLALEPGSVHPGATEDEAEEELEPDEESVKDDDDGSNGPERQS